MDRFCFYTVRLSPERYVFVICRPGKHHSVLKDSLSMFKLFRPDFEANLLSVRELPLIKATLKSGPIFLDKYYETLLTK